MVEVPIADLRAMPGDGAELVDQVHFREWLRVLGETDGWRYVQAEDHYFGWIRSDRMTMLPGEFHGRAIGPAVAPVYRAPDKSSEIVAYIPAGAQLATKQSPCVDGPWIGIDSGVDRPEGATVYTGYVSLDDVIDPGDLPCRYPTPDDLITTAEAFLGVPYLWGGTTGLGIDCSGYVQQVYRLNGIRLDRDAHQQAMEGRAVKVPAPGDLIFFGEEGAVTHVALATGERTFLNAPERGKKVERGDLAGDRTVLAIRRYLP
jgi:cell wall-associated NlpC family hydrolase